MEHAASMIGYVTMAMTIMPMFAPAIGGLLEENFHWQYSVRLMYLMGMIAIALIWFDQTETLRKEEKRTGLISDYYQLMFNKKFWSYIVVMGFCVGSYFSFLTGAPILSDQYFNLDPSVQGYFFAIMGLGFFLGNYLTGKYAVKIGPNKFMLWGCYVALLGPLMQGGIFMSFYFGPLSFFLPMLFVGLGQGLIVPNAAAGVVSVDPKLAGSASGLAATIQILIGGFLALITGYIVPKFMSPLPLIIILSITILVSLAFSLRLYNDSELDKF